MKSKLVWLIAAVVIAVLLWQAGVLPVRLSNKYQAVFLSNNQVYFGKLYNAGSDYPVLRDIYYLQVTQVLQPKDPKSPAQQINLVKLGGELHGPEDEMRINKGQILFVEDLKSDSQVVAAIADYQKAQK
ncbi:MAG: hypothetical protein Q7J73_03055 [Dehalococcoidales bacterium]|nr:hypothetical protein [Dehalococcoidales bacterium]